MARVAELMERGARAYKAGRIKDARAAFLEVVAADPTNAKARSFLAKIEDSMPSMTPFPGAHLAARPGGQPGAGYAHSPWDEGPAAEATIVVDPSGGLDLRAVAEKSDLRPLVPEGGARPIASAGDDVGIWMTAAKELFALGDFTGSLELIEKILQVDPDHAEARAYLKENEATLFSMYESKLGRLSSVPRLAIKPEEVMWLNLDHRAGFLLAQIDGVVDYESLFALSGLPRLDTARILANLLAEGVIAG